MLIRRKLCVKTALNLREKCARVWIYSTCRRLNAGGSWKAAAGKIRNSGWSCTAHKKAAAAALQMLIKANVGNN